jgi:hypothetical protein
VAWLTGALNVDRVLLVGGAAEFGEPWLAAVRDTLQRSALGLLAAETTVQIGRLHDDGVVLGASALLMTHELGLSLSGVPADRGSSRAAAAGDGALAVDQPTMAVPGAAS